MSSSQSRVVTRSVDRFQAQQRAQESTSRSTSPHANITGSSETVSTRQTRRQSRYDANRGNPPLSDFSHVTRKKRVEHSPIQPVTSQGPHPQGAGPKTKKKAQPETPNAAAGPPPAVTAHAPATEPPPAASAVTAPPAALQQRAVPELPHESPTIPETPVTMRSRAPSQAARSHTGTSKSARERAYRLAKAREELAAAKLAALEAEDDLEEEDEDEDALSTAETTQRVEQWLQRSVVIPAIDIRPHNESPPQLTQVNKPAGEHLTPPPMEPLPRSSHYEHPSAPAAHYRPAAQTSTPAPQAGDHYALQSYKPSSDVALLTEAIRAAILAGKDSPNRRPADLPPFTGTRRQWMSFKKVYTDTAPFFTPGENTARLQAATHALRNTALGEFIMAGATPELIMEKLEESYGNTATLAALEYKNLRELPRLTDNAQDICSFSIKLGTIMSTLQLVDPETSRYNSEILRALHDKLTINLQSKWYTFSSDKPRRENDVMLMVNFMQEEARLREPYTIINDTYSKYNNAHNTKTQYSQPPRYNSTAQKPAYQKPTYAQARGTSYNNTPRAPAAASAPPKYQRTNTAVEKSDNAPPTEKVSCARSSKVEGFLKILPVTVSGPLGSREAWALLDDGSTITLLDQELANAVGAPGLPEPLHIEALHTDITEASASRRVIIQLTGANTTVKIEARTVSNFKLSAQRVPEELVNQCAHLLDIKKHLVYTGARPTVLVGQDNYHLLLAEQVKKGPPHLPVASLTPLGWVLHGAETRSLGHRVNFINTVEEKLDHFFNVDSLAITPTRPASDPEEKAARILSETTRRVSENEYEVGLLWNKDKVHLPYNYNSALKRLFSVERRLDKDPELRAKYEAEMDALAEKGYAEIAQSTGTPNKTFFLPHFPVINPMKPGKLRIVHDAAAIAKGTSLNNNLLTGPDLLQSLPGVLCRFRQHEIALSADIKEMFMRVQVRPEDRDALRYLWRGAARGDTPPTEYRMTRLVFGAASSPASAIYVKNENAQRYADSEPDAVNAIIKKHYVDDYLDSFPSLAQAIETATKVRNIQAEGNFELRGWKSNSPALLAALGEAQPSTETSVDLDEGPGASERVLGLIWRPTTDELTFNLDLARLPADVLQNSRPTKREALKIVMSLYDPLGYAAPVTVRAKATLQEAWRLGISWDSRLPEQLGAAWAEWLKNLQALRHVSIPRCYPGYTHAVNIQLHVFTDASQEAYATALYWRTTSITGEIKVTLIMAKARVCPIKLHSVPRLELLAAVMGARMASTVKQEHERQPDSTTFWTDSKTVLQWVRNGSRSYKQFVAHRIAAIQEHTKVSEWRYVPTKLNVADDSTRETPRDFTSNHRWYTGPEYLYLPESEWPQTHVDELHDEEANKERTYVAIASCKQDVSKAIPNPTRFSKWERYIRATARVLQFIHLCRKKEAVHYKRTKANAEADPAWRKTQPKQAKKVTNKTFTCTVDNYIELPASLLHKATTLIWQCVQTQAFEEDIAALKLNKPVTKQGKLNKLSVKLTDGMVTLVSRIDAVMDTQLVKNPIILDGKNPATRLYIDYVHRRLHHARAETVVNEVKQLYWVLHLRPTARQVTHKCRPCITRRATPPSPPTGNHPYMRLAHHKRAYTYTGWDFFGPYTVTVGRATQKRYVALFTCLTTRNVHLEVAASLSTDSAIAALRRFIARRGCPTEIWSDNGTNLHGAEKELRRALETEMNKAATNKGISWRFIPPSAPFMGGAWERLVSSVKKALSTVLTERHVNDETLSTLMAEVEFSVNSRPLTHVSVDQDEPAAITPNHFTVGPAAWNPTPGTFNEKDTVGKSTWRTTQRLADMFWSRWLREYLPTLQDRREPTHKGPIIAIDDVVLIVDNTLPRNTWPMGRVTALHPGQDGVTRVVDVKTKGGTLRRPTKKLVILPTTPDTPSPPASQQAAARTPLSAPPPKTPSPPASQQAAARTPLSAPPPKTPSPPASQQAAARTPLSAPPPKTPSPPASQQAAARTPLSAPPPMTPSPAADRQAAARTPINALPSPPPSQPEPPQTSTATTAAPPDVKRPRRRTRKRATQPTQEPRRSPRLAAKAAQRAAATLQPPA